jgi:hypothetical protein
MERRTATRGRKGGSGVWRNVGWFKALDGNGIRAGTYFEEEDMWGVLEDSVGPVIGGRKRWVAGWGADKDKG